VYPENPAILYITTTSGTLLKTMDSCRSWEFLSNSMGDYTKVAISKTKPEILYVYNEDFFYSTLYKSKDGGSSWEQIDAQQIVKNK